MRPAVEISQPAFSLPFIAPQPSHTIYHISGQLTHFEPQSRFHQPPAYSLILLLHDYIDYQSFAISFFAFSSSPFSFIATHYSFDSDTPFIAITNTDW
jgi:hypothetical protein